MDGIALLEFVAVPLEIVDRAPGDRNARPQSGKCDLPCTHIGQTSEFDRKTCRQGSFPETIPVFIAQFRHMIESCGQRKRKESVLGQWIHYEFLTSVCF